MDRRRRGRSVAAMRSPTRPRRRRTLIRVGLVLGALLVVAQAVPYGRAHHNPRHSRDVRWADATTARLFAGACGDCHSDHTTWPWYSDVAPVSWLVQKDVDDGRRVFDTSRWDHPQPALGDVVEQTLGSEMPPVQYKLIHGASRLSSAERRTLAAGLRRTYAADPPAGVSGGG